MASVASSTKKTVYEVKAWQAQWQTNRLPNQCSRNSYEQSLGRRFAKLLLRRHCAISTGAERKRLEQLPQAEIALVNSVPGVPRRGCATTSLAERMARDAAAAEAMFLYFCPTPMNVSSRSSSASSAVALGESQKSRQKRDRPQEANRHSVAEDKARARSKRLRYKQSVSCCNRGAATLMQEQQTG